MSEPGDFELIQAVQGRDSSALMALYDRHRGVSFALAYRIVGDAGTAEEAVQDAFMQVWRRAESYDPDRGSGFRAWLLKIVHNRAIDLRRRRSGHAQSMIDLETVEFIPASVDVQQDVTAGLEREQIRIAVAALPPPQRDAIALAYFDGLTHQEIAERTSTPLGTVKGRLRLGLQKLAESLTEVARPA
ncbi:MAG: sigma-70 family RNA polymerase sigma factor [Chloroflexia bacterium]|nr:sigma-70 family RNA polymerase sigma factor [Chloroflexia bacterium]